MLKFDLKLKIIISITLLIILILSSNFIAIRYFARKLYFNELISELKNAQTIFEGHQKIKKDNLISQAILIADLPKFKASIETNDIPTIRNVAESYQYLIPNDFILITDHSGNILTRMGDAEEIPFPSNMSELEPVENALKLGREGTSLWAFPDKLYEIVAVPFFTQYRLMGSLIIGFSINNQTAEEIKSMINSEVIFFLDRKVIATSFPKLEYFEKGNSLDGKFKNNPEQIEINDENYLTSKTPLKITNSDYRAYYIIFHSLKHYYIFLKSLSFIFIVIAIGVFFFAFLSSFVVSQTITNPLNKLTKFMKEISDSEDLTKKLEIKTSDQNVKIMSDAFNLLIKSLNQAKDETEDSYLSAIEAMVISLDTRDNEIAGHSQRVALYTVEIAKAIGLFGSELIDIERGALLHDIGKIGIPDAILRKPGSLSDNEWEIMKKHPYIGHVMLQKIKFLRRADDIVYSHQERYDGTGYPRKIKGKEIPIGARIFAIADALDAMTTERPYRKARSFKEARQEIYRFSGIQFDPEIVEAFSKIPDEVWMKIGKKVESEYVPTIKTIRVDSTLCAPNRQR